MPQPPDRQQREPSGTDIMVHTMKSPAFVSDIDTMLPPNIDRKKFLTAAITAVQRGAERLEGCDRQSVYNAVADAAARGLVPDGRQGAIVPFNTKVKRGNQDTWVKKAQFMIMPEGIIESAARAGIHMYAVSVYAGDHIRLWNDGEGQHIEHQYDAFSDRGERVGAVAVGRTRDGAVYVEVMNQGELERARKSSKSPDSGPWKDWPERMEQKSALHRLNKRMPGVSLPDDDEFAPPERIRVAATEASPAAAPSQPPPFAPPPGRPKGLQRMVDQKTGEVFSPPPEQAPTEPQQPSPEPAAAPTGSAPAPGTKPPPEDVF